MTRVWVTTRSGSVLCDKRGELREVQSPKPAHALVLLSRREGASPGDVQAHQEQGLAQEAQPISNLPLAQLCEESCWTCAPPLLCWGLNYSFLTNTPDAWWTCSPVPSRASLMKRVCQPSRAVQTRGKQAPCPSAEATGSPGSLIQPGHTSEMKHSSILSLLPTPRAAGALKSLIARDCRALGPAAHIQPSCF